MLIKEKGGRPSEVDVDFFLEKSINLPHHTETD